MDPNDPRAIRTRRRVLEATVGLLAERGVESTTMDAVASAAGVSRSTLYRHWPERLPLLIDTIEHLGDRLRHETSDEPADDGGSLETTLQRIIGSLGAGLRSPEWGPISSSLAAAAEHDRALAEAYRDHVSSRRHDVVTVLRNAQQRDELPSSLDLDWAVSVLAGPLYYHRLVLHQPLDKEQVSEHVHRTLTLMLSVGASHG